MRKTLDWIYRLSGIVAVTLLVAIALLTLAQIVAREFGAIVPSADDFATFAMAAAIFLGLAYTYRAGGHVRVMAVQQSLPAPLRRILEIVLLSGTCVLLANLLWYTGNMIQTSHELNEHTVGLLPIPTWIPMTSMLIGIFVFMLAVFDDLIAVLRGQPPSYAGKEEVAPPD